MGEKSEPTGTSALPGGALHPKSWCEMEVRSGWGYHPGYQTGTVWLPTGAQREPSVHLQVKRPQSYCYTPPTADLRPRTGAPGPVQQHA